jgi:hypothetical protein
MTRTALWVPTTVLILTFAVVAAPASAKPPRGQPSSAQQQCDAAAVSMDNSSSAGTRRDRTKCIITDLQTVA